MQIISPTQHAVEEDLRLHIHSVHLPDYPTPDPKDPRYVKVRVAALGDATPLGPHC